MRDLAPPLSKYFTTYYYTNYDAKRQL